MKGRRELAASMAKKETKSAIKKMDEMDRNCRIVSGVDQQVSVLVRVDLARK